MKDFDIQISMNGFENEINSNVIRENKIENKSYFVDKKDSSKKEEKKAWTDTLTSLTKQFKSLTGYQTNEQLQAKREKELAERGTKYKILGMNPFVAIGLSFVVIIGGSIAITKIKAG
jgi:hypothetical protein